MSASLIIQNDVTLRAAQALVFAFLAWTVSPRLRLYRSAMFLSATVAFNLLTPSGRVLARIAGLEVTNGALLVGVGKAATLGGLLFVSRLMVDRRLRLPGTVGSLIATTIAYLNRLMDARTGFSLRSPVLSIDRALEAATSTYTEPDPNCSKATTTVLGVACTSALIGVCGVAVVWGYLRA